MDNQGGNVSKWMVRKCETGVRAGSELGIFQTLILQPKGDCTGEGRERCTNDSIRCLAHLGQMFMWTREGLGIIFFFRKVTIYTDGKITPY